MSFEVSITKIIFSVVIILISITVHEAVHAFVAHRLGDRTAQLEGRLSLNPLRHVDLVMTVLLPVVLMLVGLPPILIAKPVPFNPENVKYGDYGAALVAIAGPFSNLALAAVVAVLVNFMPLSGIVLDVAKLFMQINILFFVFNMIPFPPLDGSRLLFAVAPDGLRRVMLQIESLGLVGILIFMLLLLPFFGPIITNLTTSIYNFLLL